MSHPQSPEPGSLLGLQAAVIKTERAFDLEVVVERIKSEAEQLLYADHEVKEEMVIGPTVIQRPKLTPEPVTKNIDSDAGLLLCCWVKLTDARDELQCGLCGEWSLSAAELQQHKQTHAREASDTTLIQVEGRGPTDVPVTKNIDSDAGLLLRCWVKLTDARDELQCGLCGEWSLSADELQQHKQTHAREASDTTLIQVEGRGPTDVPVTKNIDSDAGILLRCWVKLTDTRDELQCGLCGEWILSAAKLEQHKLTHAREASDTTLIQVEGRGPTDGVCARGGECSAELRARATPHDNGLPHNPIQPQLEPLQCQPSSDASLQPCHSTPHQRNHSARKTFACHDCHKMFKKRIILVQHVQIHSEVKPFTCNVCDKKFTQSGNLLRHNNIHSGKRPFTCDVCHKKFTLSGGLLRHKKIHSAEKAFACNVCDKKFTRSEHLLGHKSIHSGKIPFACNVCDKKFTRSEHLLGHKSIHSGKRPFACNVCDKKFTRSEHLLRHKNIHSGKRPFACNVCDKKFTRSEHLLGHKYIHSGKTPFTCDVCDKKFTLSGSLLRHKKIHSAEKAFACNVCDKKFTRSEHLLRHKNIHSGKRPFTCDVCHKKFTLSEYLLRHKKIHSAEKAFACNVCDKKFTRSENLLRHKNIHSGIKPFVCDVC